MNSRVLCSSLLAAWTLSGCSGTTPDDRSTSAPPGVEVTAESTILASTDVGYGTIEFTKITTAEGNFVMMTELASAYLRSTPLDALMKGRHLTMLEIFLAVNPGATPAEELVRAHEEDVVRFHRQTADVVHATFDRNAPIQKSAAGCSAWIFEDNSACYYWGNKLSLDLDLVYYSLPVGTYNTDSYYRTMHRVVLGMCNEDNHTITERFHWSNDGWYANHNTSTPFSVPAGTAARHWANAATSGPAWCGSPFAVPCPHPVSYYEAVDPGATYSPPNQVRIRTAEEFFDYGACTQ